MSSLVLKFICEIESFYSESLKRSAYQAKQMVELIPKEWNVPVEIIKEKLQQLFDKQWTDAVWNNFVECLKENIEHE